jgi:hypothetical protein
MFTHPRKIISLFMLLAGSLCQPSCRKMVTVSEPINSITTMEIFATNTQAASAMAGVYSRMINSGSVLSFTNGQITALAGMSSDELLGFGLNYPSLAGLQAFNMNRLLFSNSYTSELWQAAYKTIYGANSVIEGIAASTSGTLVDSVRRELTAEAKFVRAFCYFYLVNLFGDVPLALTVDFNKTRNMARTPLLKVYEQIVRDLKDAQAVLPADYSAAGAASERILPNRWAATALLARVFLYTRDYVNAEAQAAAVIDQAALYGLETDPNNVFLVNSREGIWQMKQTFTEPLIRNATTEGNTMLPYPLSSGVVRYYLPDALLNAFEPNDLRRSAWTGSTDNSMDPNGPQVTTWYPYKYKLGAANSEHGASPAEYYMMLRLAEVYLIRAEARAYGPGGGTAAAIGDLNLIRARAGLGPLPNSLDQTQTLAAVAQERRVELFAEWGHRWLDLKRTGQAHNILSAIPLKQPWTGDYQLLYPIPPSELKADHFLVQNPGY